MNYGKVSMKLVASILLAIFFVTKSSATIMHFKLEGSRPKCLYADLIAPGEKFVFFYAVLQDLHPSHVTVTDPEGRKLYSESKATVSDIVFSTITPGTHEFCFRRASNTMFQEDLISVEVVTENDTRLPVSSTMQSESVEGRSVRKLTGNLTKMAHVLVNAEHLQRSIRSTEHRDENYIKSSIKNISVFSLIQTIILCALSLFQVACVHVLFFRNNRLALV